MLGETTSRGRVSSDDVIVTTKQFLHTYDLRDCVNFRPSEELLYSLLTESLITAFFSLTARGAQNLPRPPPPRGAPAAGAGAARRPPAPAPRARVLSSTLSNDKL